MFNTLHERVIDSIHFNGDCWLWHGVRKNGRPIICVDGDIQCVSTYIYKTYYGIEGKNFAFTRLCNDKECLNPEHRVIFNKEQKFLHYLIVRDKDQCWGWNGFITKDGRPCFAIGMKRIIAQRVSYEYYNGTQIKPGAQVRRSCDNKLCCNPAHLYLKHR